MEVFKAQKESFLSLLLFPLLNFHSLEIVVNSLIYSVSKNGIILHILFFTNNWLLNWATQAPLRCLFLSERSQSEKVTHKVISNYLTFWKRRNYEDGEKISGCQELRGGEAEHRRIFRALQLLCVVLWWWILVITHLSKTIRCTTPRVYPNVNDGLSVIMVCH